jgi:hypothetical protein
VKAFLVPVLTWYVVVVPEELEVELELPLEPEVLDELEDDDPSVVFLPPLVVVGVIMIGW